VGFEHLVLVVRKSGLLLGGEYRKLVIFRRLFLSSRFQIRLRLTGVAWSHRIRGQVVFILELAQGVFFA
jgi:hypothetical protein